MTAMPHLLLQLTVILVTARVLAFALQRFGQPPVIGEMLAGLALGPIVFGAFAPDLHATLFPREGLGPLEGLSELGLVLFMFIVGAELRAPAGARRQIVAAGWIGTLGVALPMLFGFAIAPLLHARFAPAGVGEGPFALFMAASMAITAFPVLARILKDSRMTRSAIGQLALASTAIADVLAWGVLAFVVAAIGTDGGWTDFVRTIGGLFVVAAVCFGVLRPLLARVLARHARDGRPDGAMLGLLLVLAFAMAAATEWLGLHALFGAFLFGACLPRDDRLLDHLVERIEHVAILVLMPVFFALAGLNTTPQAFAGGGFALLLVLAAAILGKVLGAGAGARISGLGWRDSAAIGSLMNARGLMELIVLKIGLDAGVIGPEMFTMLLVMAIVTTLMTTPMLRLCLRGAPRHARMAENGT
ncbi:MAG: cation:proton antiporter [Lysobacteraceae bacterium]|nr:MAG: cation:proton antiporter [Xanthomonadaceae bacterium]